MTMPVAGAWRRRIGCFTLLVIVLAAPMPGAAPQEYVGAAVDRGGSLRIAERDGKATSIVKEPGEVGFDKIAISPDGRAVGWVGLRENCCTSYPVPTRLFVFSAGERRVYRGVDLPVWDWKFVDGGKNVAFRQETVHGGLGVHYEVRDVATGRLVAEWRPEYGPDNQRRESQSPPRWVIEFDSKN